MARSSKHKRLSSGGRSSDVPRRRIEPGLPPQLNTQVEDAVPPGLSVKLRLLRIYLEVVERSRNGITARQVDSGTMLSTGKVDAKGDVMRSDKVFEALHTLQNRYMLCQIASKATRKFHKPNTRIQDTTNDVLNRISDNERANVMADPVNAKDAQRRAA
jgi:hypothetical protein